MNRLCTICARGGSKGVPGKNIRPINGKPLIAWTVEQARASGLFSHVAVSSDDAAILAAGGRAGADILIERPAELATDEIGKIGAIVHAFREAEARSGEIFDTLVDLDATSPLRSVDDIRGAVALLEERRVSNVITAAPARRSPYFNQIEETPDGFVRLSKRGEGAVVRRQDAPRVFDMNASIYVWNRAALLERPAVFCDDTLLFEMPEERSHDIDSELDFRIVEMLMERRGGEGRRYRRAHDLAGRRAVVTGAAGILGRHFAAALADHGADVVLVDRAGDGLDEFRSALADAYPVRIEARPVDVADPDAVAKLVAQIEAGFGPIDILHNNAASKGPDLSRFFDPPEGFSPDIWREIMAVNVDGYFFMAREVGTRMAARGRGSIIQTASIYGVVGPDQRIYEGSSYLGHEINTPAVYSASKAAVVGLTKYFATYWGRRGVRVNTLTPGGVRSGQNDVFEQKYSYRVPLGRMGEPEDMANALVFLASDASAYVSGQNLIVDGGLTAW